MFEPNDTTYDYCVQDVYDDQGERVFTAGQIYQYIRVDPFKMSACYLNNYWDEYFIPAEMWHWTFVERYGQAHLEHLLWKLETKLLTQKHLS